MQTQFSRPHGYHIPERRLSTRVGEDPSKLDQISVIEQSAFHYSLKRDSVLYGNHYDPKVPTDTVIDNNYKTLADRACSHQEMQGLPHDILYNMISCEAMFSRMPYQRLRHITGKMQVTG